MSLLLILACLCACLGPATRSSQESVRVQGDDPSEGITRDQLDEEIRRFARRYTAKVTGFYRLARMEDNSPEERLRLSLVQLEANRAAIGIAIGENPVTNLLDMLVLSTLTRMMAEDAAIDYFGDERGTDLIGDMRALETDIWILSDRVLTPSQQDVLRDRIDEWRAQNPDQTFVYQVRFGSFSSYGDTGLDRIERTGGLVAQFARTADAAEEFRRLGDRLMFYLDSAPSMVSLQTQTVVYEFLRQPELQETLGNANSAAETIEGFPQARLAFIDQLFDRLAAERIALLSGIAGEQDSISRLLADMQPVLESASLLTANLSETMSSVERTAIATNLHMGGGREATDIGSYRQLAVESAITVAELRGLIDSLDALVRSEAVDSRMPTAFQTVRDEIDYFLHRLFVLLMLSIAVFFAGLFLYRHARYKYHRSSN